MTMPLLRAFLLLLLLASLSPAADIAKLRTLRGLAVEGELVGITDKHITIKSKEGESSTPFEEVLDLDLRPSALPAAKYIDVELTDGSLLHCGQFGLKNKEVELKLALGQEVKLPLSTVAYVLTEAQDAAVRTEWQKLLAKQGNRDLLAVKKNDVVNGLEGTLGDGDDKGETIEFDLNGKKVRVNLARIHGMSFSRKLEGNVKRPTLCKVHDTTRNLLVAHKITQTPNGYTVTTVSGATIEYTSPLLARLDFSTDKLTYLSDLEPVKKVETSSLEGIDHYRRDKNLDGGPLRISGQIYPKGLAVHAYTELIYDIGGEYKEFKAVLGVDDQVGGDSHVKVTIEGDNKALFTIEIKRKDKKAIPVAVDVKNIKLLRIVVSSANILDLGDHVNLADAKVSK